MNIFLKRSSLALGALLLSGAPALADGLSYSYIQASYQDVELDLGPGPNADGDGFAVAGSVEISDDWFIFADYGSFDLESTVDFTELSVGAGYHDSISTTTDWYASLAYVKAEVSASGFGSADDSGYGVAAGLRSMISPSLELYGNIGYADLGDGANGTTFGAGLWYTVSGNVALGLGASFGEDVTTLGIGVRLYFDK
jgi:hypothetical protein